MSRTYRNTKGSNKRLVGQARDLYFQWHGIERNIKNDYNDCFNSKLDAYRIRQNKSYIYRKHSKSSRKEYRNQDNSRFNKNLKIGLTYGNWDELYLISSNKDVNRYT